MRSTCTNLKLSAAVLMLLWTFPLFSLTEEAKAQAHMALVAEEEGRYEDAYKIWAELLSKRKEADLGEEGYSLIRSRIYHAAFKKVEEYGDDCARSLTWIEKGKRPGAPDYLSSYDVLYPALLLAEGVCAAQESEYEKAYDMLSAGRVELLKAPPQDAAVFMPQADQYLAQVKEHAISEGDYVTNKGAFQIWIGRVESRSNNSVVVRLTYVNKDLAGGLGSGTTSFSVNDCKPLGAISADAALKGWKE